MNEYEVGDKIRIVMKGTFSFMCPWKWSVEMDKYIGNVYTINDVNDHGVLLDGILEMYRFPFNSIKHAPTFNVGEMVKIVNKVDRKTNDYNNKWVDDMDSFIGKTFVISSISPFGIRFESNDDYNGYYAFPPESLEKVSQFETREKHIMNKLREFDIEAAKNGANVVTRLNKPVRILTFDRVGSNYPIIGLIADENGVEHVYSWTINGYHGDTSDDLMLGPNVKYGIYGNSDGEMATYYVYDSKEAAQSRIDHDFDSYDVRIVEILV